MLAIRETNWLTDVAFSPDGRRVAVSSKSVFGYQASVTVWRLTDGHGIKSLRGLGSEIEQVTFSPDDHLIAALSHDSRIGVWDVKADRLLHVIDAPRTEWVDNAAIAFTPDNQFLVYAAAGNVSMCRGPFAANTRRSRSEAVIMLRTNSTILMVSIVSG